MNRAAEILNFGRGYSEQRRFATNPHHVLGNGKKISAMKRLSVYATEVFMTPFEAKWCFSSLLGPYVSMRLYLLLDRRIRHGFR